MEASSICAENQLHMRTHALRMWRQFVGVQTPSLSSFACAVEVLFTGRTVPVKATGLHPGASFSSYLASSGVSSGGGGGGTKYFEIYGPGGTKKWGPNLS